MASIDGVCLCFGVVLVVVDSSVALDGDRAGGGNHPFESPSSASHADHVREVLIV